MTEFNPNDIGIANGKFFGLPYPDSENKIFLIPVPWDVTVSYGEGTSNGPDAIMEASIMFDLFDPAIPNAWECRIGTIPYNKRLYKLNKATRRLSLEVIENLADGKQKEEVIDLLKQVNEACDYMNKSVYNSANEVIDSGKIAAVVGGEHSVPYGLVKALSEKYSNFGILHIDAHADLREAYEGFTYSHASIMFNIINNIPQVSRLCQVAIRDFCDAEYSIIQSNDKIAIFPDNELRRREFTGETWEKTCNDIIKTLPDNVYISFDIDGLSPELCPHTGTPVPGGLTFNKADYLLLKLAQSGKRIIGFDLVEVAPSPDGDEWDANVGAKLLYKLALYTNLASASAKNIK